MVITRKVVIATLLVLCAALFVVHTRTSQATAKISWEYRVAQGPGLAEMLSANVSDVRQLDERFLNDLGGDGWDLVAYDSTTRRYILKRQR